MKRYPVRVSYADRIITNDYISVDVTPLFDCNMKCSYCNVKGPKKAKVDEHQDTSKFTEQVLGTHYLDLHALGEYFKKVNAATGKKIRVFMIGGEPTLHPGLVDFCKEMSCLDFMTVNIYTNFTKPIEYYEALMVLGMNVNASYHSIDGKKNTEFITKSVKFMSTGLWPERFSISLMLEPSDKNFKDIESITAMYRMFHFNEKYSIEHRIVKDIVHCTPDKYLAWYDDFQLDYVRNVVPVKYADFDNNNPMYEVEYNDGTVEQQSMLKFDLDTFGHMTYNDIHWKCNAGNQFFLVIPGGQVVRCPSMIFDNEDTQFINVHDKEFKMYTDEVECKCSTRGCEHNCQKCMIR